MAGSDLSWLIGEYSVYYYRTDLNGDIDQGKLTLKKSLKASFTIEDHDFDYNGKAEVKDDILYITLNGIGKHKETLSMVYKPPLDKKFDRLWGVWNGISRNREVIAIRCLLVHGENDFKDYKELEKYFEDEGAIIDNNVLLIPNKKSLKKTDYNWILGELWFYQYDDSQEHAPKLIEIPVEFFKSPYETLKCRWNIVDKNNETYEYDGVVEIKWGNIFILSKGSPQDETVLSVFSVPFNKKIKKIWGVGTGTNLNGVPVSYRFLINKKRLSLKEAENEFIKIGVTPENSIITTNINADQSNETKDYSWLVGKFHAYYFKTDWSGEVSQSELEFREDRTVTSFVDEYFSFKGYFESSDVFLFVQLNGVEHQERGMFIFPYRSDKNVDHTWGIQCCLSRHLEIMSGYVFLSKEKLSPEDIGELFEYGGLNIDNSVLRLSINEAFESSQRKKIQSKIINMRKTLLTCEKHLKGTKK